MKQTVNIATGFISFGLLATLAYKLAVLPGGMIEPILFFSKLLILFILLGGLFLTWLTSLIRSRKPNWTIYFVTTAIALAFFHYQIYSPTLQIIVPENYAGQVSLVRSNVTDNILTIDSNGIGYLNEWTFDRLRSKPKLRDKKGTDLTDRFVRYYSSSFFAFGSTTHAETGKEIITISFQVVPPGMTGEIQYSPEDISGFVDKEKIK
jgi:hypothetical protein